MFRESLNSAFSTVFLTVVVSASMYVPRQYLYSQNRSLTAGLIEKRAEKHTEPKDKSHGFSNMDLR